MGRATPILLGTLVACGAPPRDGFLRSDVDASLWADGSRDAGEESAPVVEITVPSCPTSLPLPAGTDPSAMLDIRITGPCSRYCSFAPTIACNDAGVSWSTFTLCSCDADASWDCVSDYPMQATCCGAETYACPSESAPVLYPEDGGDEQVLPQGDCNCGNGCILRTRQQCSDGTTGVTTKYGCECSAGAGEGGLWQCTSAWATIRGCDGTIADGGAPDGGIASEDSGAYWIHVEGDGDPYDMTDQLGFTDECGDGFLVGWFATHTPPSVTTGVTPGETGTYVDRQGDYWTLTSTSIEPAPGQGGIGGASAEGTLILTAVRADGATMQLTLTFHTPYEAFLC